MKIANGQGLLGLLQALREHAAPEEQYGDPIPLNAEALAEQKRHADACDGLLETMQLAERAVRNAREALEDEQRLWAKNMRKAMPELKDVEEFRIADDQKHYTLPVPADANKVKPPAWVAEMLQKEAEGQPKH